MSENWKRLQKTLGKVTKTTTRKKSTLASRRSVVARPALKGDLSRLIEVADIPKLQGFQRASLKNLSTVLSKDDTALFDAPVTKQDLKYTPSQQKPGQFLAIDCEFVGTGFKGQVSELGRVSIVNYYGYTIMDEYVKPLNYVTDWRTKWSGLTPAVMHNAITFKDAQDRVAKLVSDRYLVGHGLKNDTRVLMLSHPKMRTIDTQELQRYKDEPTIKGRPGLKKLCDRYLGLDVQLASHCSVEDAQASMLLFRTFKNEYLNRKPAPAPAAAAAAPAAAAPAAAAPAAAAPATAESPS